MPTLQLTVDGEIVTNSTTIRDAPSVLITANNVQFTNSGTGVIYSSAVGSPTILIQGAGTTITNLAGGFISGGGSNGIAIQGSIYNDTIINAGDIYDRVLLGDGNDSFTQRGRPTSGLRVDLGAGDDVFRHEATGYFTNQQIVGGSGFDRLQLVTFNSTLLGSGYTGFEQLDVAKGTNFWNLDGFNDYQSVVLAAGGYYNFLRSVNPNADLSVSGGYVSINRFSLFRDVFGGSGSDQLYLENGGIRSAALGAGDDQFMFKQQMSLGNAATIAGIVDGGSGTDRLTISVDGGVAVDASRFVGFELLNTGFGTTNVNNFRLINASGFTSFALRTGETVAIANSNLAGTAIALAFNVTLTVEESASVDNLTLAGGSAGTIGDPTKFVSIINSGLINGAVSLGIGNDNYDGRLGSVPGAVFGYAGDDLLRGGAAAEQLNGGAGNDRLFGNGSTTVAVFSGARGDYAFAVDLNGNLVVRDLRGGAPDGMDTLSGIATLKFSDGSVTAASVTPNQAPTAVTLTNLVSFTPENGAAVRVADVTVADDGRGTNNLALAGADAASFELRTDASGGIELWFTGGADAEARTGYQVQVVVDDPALGGTPDASAAFALTIGDVNESGVTAPVDVDGQAGGGIAENATGPVGITARSSDSDLTVNGVSYSLVAADGSAGTTAGNFAIDPLTGEVRLVAAFDREALGASGTVQVTVRATSADGSAADTAFNVAVANVNEGLAFTSPASVDTAENDAAAAVVSATDQDGDAVSYSIVGGADAALFTVDAATGALSFRSAPDFEAPGDMDGDNRYEVVVHASDGSLGADQAVTVTVGNRNEGLSFTSGASFAVAENGAAVGTVAASDLDGDVVIYSIVGGADAALFTLDAATGALSFRSAPDFEAPGDSNMDNDYQVLVAAADGALSVSQLVTVSVRNSNEAPTITSGGGADSAAFAVNENGAAVTTVVARDAEGSVTYAIAGGADAALFAIDAATGALRFVTAPNFEAPGDANRDNRYEVVVRASDGSLSDSQSLLVTVQNLRDGLTINGSSKADTLTGSAAEDSISGLGGHDTLYGNEGDDLLSGGDGNDKLFGGAGADTLTGGAGADTFTFSASGDSNAAAMDLISDFNRAQNDRISVSGIDANALLAGDQAFSFIGTNAFTGAAAGQLRSYVSNARTYVAGDVNGDGVADFIIDLGSASVQSSDFLL